MTKEESSDNVKFMTPRARIIVLGRVHIYYKSYGENALFLQNFSSLHPGIDQTNESVVMMTEEECTKIVNFITRIQGRGKVSHYIVKIHFVIFFCINIQRIDLLLD